MNPSNLGPNLRKRIADLGLTHEAFSRRIDTPSSALRSILTSRQLPGTKMLCRILTHLPGVTFEDLVSEKSEEDIYLEKQRAMSDRWKKYQEKMNKE